MTALAVLAAARAISMLRVLVVMLWLMPSRGPADVAFRLELARAEIAVTLDAHEQDLLSSIAFHESLFDRDVAECRRMGVAGDRTAWQIVPRNEADRRVLCVSLEDDAAIALDRVRESLSACRSLPHAERLAVYARGRCSSAEGRRLSRVRWVSAPRRDAP